MPETGSKIKPELLVSDPDFHNPVPQGCNLFAFIDDYECTLALSDHGSQTFLVVESWKLATSGEFAADELNTISENSVILKPFPYRNIVICCGARASIPVPAALFDPNEAANQYRFSNQVKEKDLVFTDDLYPLEAYNVFAIPGEMHDYLTRLLPQCVLHHSLTPVIKYLLAIHKHSTDPAMLVNVHGSYIEVVVVKTQYLLYSNRFEYEKAEELIYYILFVCEQLQLNPDSINVSFAGNVTVEDGIHQLTSRYIRNIHLSPRPDLARYSPALSVIPENNFYNLFTQPVCVL